MDGTKEAAALKGEYNGRKLHIELLRIIAIICVLFNHTGTKGFVLFTIARESEFYWLYMFMGIAVKVAVPIFFMISGAMLLGKEETIDVILKKRVLKFLIIMLVSSLVVYMHKVSDGFIAAFSLKDLGERLYVGSVTTSSWYFYAYMALLLMLPFLRKVAQHMSDREYEYMIWLYLFMQLFQILQLYVLMGLHFNENFAFFITEKIVFYPLLGYYVEHRLKKSAYDKKKIVLVMMAGVLAICLCCAMTHRYCVIFDRWDEVGCQKYFEMLIFIPAVSLYMLSKFYFMKYKAAKWFEKVIVLAGSCSFGIFVFERIYRAETQIIYEVLCTRINSLLACFVWIGCAWFLGCIVTLFLKKIPVVKKYL